MPSPQGYAMLPEQHKSTQGRLCAVRDRLAARLTADRGLRSSSRALLAQLLLDALVHAEQGGRTGDIPPGLTGRSRLQAILGCSERTLYVGFMELEERGHIARPPLPAYRKRVVIPWLADAIAELPAEDRATQNLQAAQAARDER